METITNISLITNGLNHIIYELHLEETSYFRCLREAHLVFYRSMIEALSGSNNLAVTGRPKDKERKCYYSRNSVDWYLIKKQTRGENKKSWVYSEPEISEKPEEADRVITDEELFQPNEFLISFYDALAMIQVTPFMKHYVFSKTIQITEEEMDLLEWMHENIRNTYEHFVPKIYSSPIEDLKNVLVLSIEKTHAIFDSGNIFITKKSEREKILHSLTEIKELING